MHLVQPVHALGYLWTHLPGFVHEAGIDWIEGAAQPVLHHGARQIDENRDRRSVRELLDLGRTGVDKNADGGIGGPGFEVQFAHDQDAGGRFAGGRDRRHNAEFGPGVPALPGLSAILAEPGERVHRGRVQSAFLAASSSEVPASPPFGF